MIIQSQRRLIAVLLTLSLLVTDLFAQYTATERQMQQHGLIEVQQLDSSLHVHLMYAYPDNFVGRVLYHHLHRAFLHPLAAKALSKAQRILQRTHPHLSIVVYDAARPMHIQQQMWDVVKHTPEYLYVSNPAHGGGLHNYGLAVDVSLCTLDGDSVPMGTSVDHMGALSHIDRESYWLRQGILTSEAYDNRQLLRRVMQLAGYKPLRTEWWHFNLRTRAQAKKYFTPIP